MKLYDGYGSKNITWYYGYYMAIYDEIARELNYVMVMTWFYDYDCLIFIKVSDFKNITWDYGYHMALYDEIVREWTNMMVIAWCYD